MRLFDKRFGTKPWGGPMKGLTQGRGDAGTRRLADRIGSGTITPSPRHPVTLSPRHFFLVLSISLVWLAQAGCELSATSGGGGSGATRSDGKSAAVPSKKNRKPVDFANEKLGPPGLASWASFRNGNTQLGVAGSSLPKQLELLWKIDTKYGVSATAAIVGKRVYAGTINGDLLCVEKQSGTEIWSYRSIDDSDPEKFAPAFKTAPRVTADAVFVGDEDGILHAVNRKTGKKKWTFPTNGEISGCPAIVGEKLIFGSHDSFLYCLNAEDGAEIWKFQTQDRINGSSAVIGKYTFVAGCDEHLRVIDFEGGTEESGIPLESPLLASPAVMGDMLYVGTHGGQVLAINWKTEEIVWHYGPDEDPYNASAAVTDKYVVVGSEDKKVHCIDRKTGEGVWTFTTRSQVNSSPVVVGNRVFFGSNDHHLYGVSLSGGKELWKYDLEKTITAGPAVGEECLVIGTEGSNGAIYCFGKK